MAKDLKVSIEAGHGGFGVTAGKRTPDNEYEWNFNNVVTVAAINELKNYEGIAVKRVDDPTGKRDVPLRERTDLANAWGADVHISVHHNANTGKWGTWTGTETYIYNGGVSEQTKKLANAVHAAIVDAYKLKDRGVKSANFHVLRETHMPSILLEGGYMDSTIDIKVMRNNKVLNDVGIKMAQAIAKLYGKKRKSGAVSKPVASNPAAKPANNSNTFYRVQVGAFKNVSGVAKYSKEVEKKTGISTYITEVDGFMKVQLGAFTEKGNAEKRLDAVKKAGYKDAFITTKGGNAVAQTEPNNEPAPAPKPKPVVVTPKKKFNLPKATYYVKEPKFSGSGVKEVQAALASIYYYPDKDKDNKGVDSIWGSKSENALFRFQSVYMSAKDADGIYGDKTRAKLDSIVNK